MARPSAVSCSTLGRLPYRRGAGSTAAANASVADSPSAARPAPASAEARRVMAMAFVWPQRGRSSSADVRSPIGGRPCDCSEVSRNWMPGSTGSDQRCVMKRRTEAVS